MSQVVYAGMYQPNAQATSPLSPLYVEEVAPPKRDVAKARALLKEAGVATPLSVPLIVYNTPQSVQTGEVIQSMAAKAGFAVRSTRWSSARRSQRYSAAIPRSPSAAGPACSTPTATPGVSCTPAAR